MGIKGIASLCALHQAAMAGTDGSSASLSSSGDEAASGGGGDRETQDPDEWADGLLAQWVEQISYSGVRLKPKAFSYSIFSSLRKSQKRVFTLG